MSLDFNIDSESKTVSVSSKDLKVMETAFRLLFEKTGLRIDEYSDGKLSPNHAKLLHTFVCESCHAVNSSNIKVFSDLLDKAEKTNSWVKYIGE